VPKWLRRRIAKSRSGFSNFSKNAVFLGFSSVFLYRKNRNEMAFYASKGVAYTLARIAFLDGSHASFALY